MRTHPADPRLYLVEPTDLKADPPPARVQEDLEPLRTIVSWATEYLSRPHPELGRPGAVCPFTPPALRRNLFFLTVIRGAELRLEDVGDVVRAYRDWFMELPPMDPRQAQYKTINIIFPDLPEAAWKTLIEATQDRLKAEYVPLGIMIGEFHPGPPDKAALWNPDFRPLRCPLPMLVIRHMVPTDFVFLRDRPDFMSAYLRLQGGRVPLVIRDEVRDVAESYGLSLSGEPLDPAPGCPHAAAQARAAAEAAVAAHSDCPVHASSEAAFTPSGA